VIIAQNIIKGFEEAIQRFIRTWPGKNLSLENKTLVDNLVAFLRRDEIEVRLYTKS
jgi:hypothetical protein